MAGSRRRTMRWICWLLLAATPAGCTAARDSATPAGTLTIGVLAPISGPDAGPGSDAARGVQLAVEVVNRQYLDLPIPLAGQLGLPSLRGATLTLVTADTSGGVGQVELLTAELVEKEAPVGVVVADRAEVVAAVANQIQRLRVPLLDAASSADYLSDLGMDWYFRTGPADRSLAEAAFGLIDHQARQDGAGRSVALLAEAGGDSAAGTEMIRELAGRLGYQIVVDQQLTAAQGDDVVGQLSVRQPDAILARTDTTAAVTRLAEITGRLPEPPALIGLGRGFEQLSRPPTGHPVLLRAAGWSAELAQRNPAGRAVMQLYEHRFGRPMNQPAAQAFTATIALAVAVDQAGSPEPAAVRAALRQLWLPATNLIVPWNGIQFDANGQNLLAAAVVEGWTDSGFRVVYPRELAVGPMVWATGGFGR